MNDDEIEEKLRGLSLTQLSGLMEELLQSDASNTLTNKQRQEFIELQAMLEKEATHQKRALNHTLREKGPQILELISKSLRDYRLTSEQRQKLERTLPMLAGYLMHFWLPKGLVRKVFMFLFLVIGVVGAFQLSPWFGLLVFLGCSFSPRISGEVLYFIGKLSK